MINEFLSTLSVIDEGIIIENKVDDEYAKNYSSIDRDTFNNICLMDPKTTVANGEIVKIEFATKRFLLRQYLAGETDFVEKADEIRDALDKYYQNISTYPNLMTFKTVSDFLNFINNGDSNVTVNDVEDKKDKLSTLYNKFYSDIERDIFDKIIELDPNTTKNSIGDIAKNLLLPNYLKGEDFLSISAKRIKNAGQEYYDIKSQLPEDKQQLSSYASVIDFVEFIEHGPQSDFVTGLLSNEEVDPKTRRPIKDDVNVVAATREYDILEPKSHRAAVAIGGGWNAADGMHWCTGWEPNASSENDNYWNNYTRDGGRLFCFMHKTRNRGTENRNLNWQIQVRNYRVLEFLNGHDQKAFDGDSKEDQFISFLIAKPEIALAIKDKDPFRNMQCVQLALDQITLSDEPFLVDSQEAINKLRRSNFSSSIKELIIAVEVIPTALFAGFAGLRSVEFREGLKEIGAQAFKGCTSLKTLVFPESLEIIGEEAFASCLELRGSIRLPNNLKEVRTRAFMGDKCKLKIDRARTTKIKFDNIDLQWAKSHVQSIKVQN